jgi:hypothetical protein
MWEANERRQSETHENDGDAGPACILGEGTTGRAADVQPALNYRLRNLTGREVSLIFRKGDGTEVIRRFPADETRIRVRYNRLYASAPTEWYADPEGTDAKIAMVESTPRKGILETCESIDGLRPPEGGVRLVVDPFVEFGLARRGVFRRDLLTLSRVRRDFDTRRVIGFEGLNRVNFGSPIDLAEVPSLSDPEV